jgi:hypothetical protein
MENTIREILYRDGLVVIDNLFTDEICNTLRQNALKNKYIEDRYGNKGNDYYAVNYYNPDFGSTNLIKSESDLVCKIIPSYLNKNFSFLSENDHVFQRGWYFVHNNHQLGTVNIHQDPGCYITVNLWVTPDESKKDFSENYNGMIIYTRKKRVVVRYKFNRTTIFFSQQFHESQLSRFRDGEENKKVNYTFLFGENIDKS